MKKILLSIVALAAVMGVSVNTASADPHCNACPYSCYDLGLGHKDCSSLPSARGLCCVDLTSKGLKIALEADRLLGNSAYGSAPVQDRCPAGYTPSEQKCSQEERRRGCKDIRLNSGLGCVRR